MVYGPRLSKIFFVRLLRYCQIFIIKFVNMLDLSTYDIKCLQDKPGDMAKNQSSKSVYSCLVIGPHDTGKTTFCQSFLGKERPDVSEIPAKDLPRATINSVTVYGQLKHLALLDRGNLSHFICYLKQVFDYILSLVLLVKSKISKGRRFLSTRCIASQIYILNLILM